MTAQEMPIGPAKVVGGKLSTSFTAFQPRTFAVKLAPAKSLAGKKVFKPIPLQGMSAVDTKKGEANNTGFDGKGNSYPAEMLPARITFDGVDFQTSGAIQASGQSISLPAGSYESIYVLAASTEGDREVAFKVGESSVPAKIQAWNGFIGQWDNRTWTKTEVPIPTRPGAPQPPAGSPPRTRTVMEVNGITPAFEKPADIAWFASHHHKADGRDAPYEYSYMFAYKLPVPKGATSITLPSDPNVRIFALTAAR
jgi:alpha-mannosidase